MTTKIEWTDASWSPVVGCTKIAAGCKNCYAERMAARQVAMGYARHLKDPDSNEDAWIAYSGVIDSNTGKWNGEVSLRYDQLDKPLHWKKPRRIFVCSMSDLFHPKVPFEDIDKIMAVIALCPQHTLQILTKRIERALEYYQECSRCKRPLGKLAGKAVSFPIPNLWLGTSISTQEDADKNIPILLQIPAAVRFVSVEPMLEEINLGNVRSEPNGNGKGWQGKEGGYPYLNCLTGREYTVLVGNDTKYKLDQVIVGGESGPGARPMHPDWPRSIRDQCVAAGVPFFFKQWGRFKPSQKGTIAVWNNGSYQRDPTGKFGWLKGYAFEKMMIVGKKKAGRLLDGKEWNEYPKGR